MKKFFVLALAAAVGVLVLTGCGQSGKTAYSTDLVERIAQAGAFSEELEELDGIHYVKILARE